MSAVQQPLAEIIPVFKTLQMQSGQKCWCPLKSSYCHGFKFSLSIQGFLRWVQAKCNFVNKGQVQYILASSLSLTMDIGSSTQLQYSKFKFSGFKKVLRNSAIPHPAMDSVLVNDRYTNTDMYGCKCKSFQIRNF